MQDYYVYVYGKLNYASIEETTKKTIGYFAGNNNKKFEISPPSLQLVACPFEEAV